MSTRFSGLLRASLLYGAGQALGRSAALLLLPFITAYIAPAEYGVLAVLTAFGMLLTIVFSVGLGAATAPIYFQGQARAATIWTAVAILVVSTGVMLIAAGMLADPLAWLVTGTEANGRLVLVATAATAFNILSQPFRQFLIFEERPVLYLGLSAATMTVGIVFTVWFVAGLGRGIGGVLEADLLTQAVACAMFSAPALLRTRFEVRAKLARELLALGIPLIPAFASVFVVQHGSRYMLQWLRGAEAVGVYAVGVTLASALGLLVAGFQSAWMPYFMRYAERQQEARELFGRVALYYTLIVGGGSLLFYLFARPAVSVLTAPEYAAAANLVGMAATAQFLSGLFLILMPGLYFAREVQYAGVMQGIAAGAAVLLNLALAPWAGPVGSAAAVLVAYVLLNVGQLWWNRRRGYLDVAYDWRRLRRFGTLYGCVAVLTLIPRDLPLPAEALIGALGALFVAVSVWALLTPSERVAVRRLLAGGLPGGAGAPVGLGRET